VKEGWEPLCAFLGVEVPKDKPFPHLNDRESFIGNIAWRQGRQRMVRTMVGAAVLLLGGLLFFFGRRRSQ
ncbi:MAG TPA: sulfotransferase, partial [Ktedonobacteraceae bacterium]|nr:sulfotransferase [Ktedonobacteraceae bacterium]